MSFFSFVIILMVKRELVALFCLSSLCIVIIIIMWLFLLVPCIGLQCVIVVYPDHTHLLFCFFVQGTPLTMFDVGVYILYNDFSSILVFMSCLNFMPC